MNTARDDAIAVLMAAISAADPRPLVRGALETLAGREAGQRWSGVLAVGKGAPAMYEGVLEWAGGEGDWQRLMVVPEGVSAPAWAVRADHPVPGERSVAAARAVAAFAEAQRDMEDAAVLVLLSGGASSLLTLPAGELTLEDVRGVTRALLASGVDIGQLNCVRKHIDRLKGGQLGALLSPARASVLVLSDVIGDDVGAIGSGLLAADSSTFAGALAIVRRHAPMCARVIEHLERGARGEIAETPKMGDARLARITTTIVGNNQIAVAGAAKEAMRRGYRVLRAETGTTGEASTAGWRLAELAREAQTAGLAPACIVLGGETTVTIGEGDCGKGGRNQELALAGALALNGARGIAIGAIGTDGVDGPTDAAGAVADGGIRNMARERGLDAQEHLSRHDSYTLFAALEGLIRTAPTGTNVNDVAIALIFDGDMQRMM